jgi:hypothetical protein
MNVLNARAATRGGAAAGGAPRSARGGDAGACGATAQRRAPPSRWANAVGEGMATRGVARRGADGGARVRKAPACGTAQLMSEYS